MQAGVEAKESTQGLGQGLTYTTCLLVYFCSCSTEAQQKLAALKAANPDLTAAELLKRSMEAQVVEVQKQTGITLPSYYNPAAMNPMKFAEQERKKKLLWGNKVGTQFVCVYMYMHIRAAIIDHFCYQIVY